MSLADVTSARSSPTPEACPECDTSASVTSDLHKYQVACTCKPSAQYACADDPGPPPPAKTDTPPALPPRPPTSVLATNRRNNAAVGCPTNENNCRRRKYAWWCVGCGALAAALGGLLAAQHILLRTYTASPHHLETVPAAVPAAMLVLTGVCIMSLARRRNRYSYMIKVVGACCLVCALTCVLVTITTTVIHMNKLQTLKFCEYTKLTRTCTCFSLPPDMQHSNDDDGVRCVFEGVTDCGVVHGALYWCLRGVFALSVSAVLLCIFSCMLAYQLLSHERKKMYWEQLELRCRSLYRPPVGQAATTGRPVQSNCSCCTQCHPAPTPAWDISLQHRFWAPGRIGNLYSPNPGTGRKTSAWSWFPWPRASQNSRHRLPGVPQSGDSAYGFCDGSQPTQNYESRGYPAYQYAGEGGSYDARTGQWGPPPPYSPQGRSGSRHHLHQDPAAATLLHHHHIDVHRNSMNLQNIQDHTNLPMQPHTCRNSYMMHSLEINRLNPELARINTEISQMNPEIIRNPETNRINAEMNRINPDMNRINAEMNRINPEMNRINPEMNRMNVDMNRIQELARMNPDLGRLAQMYPQDVSELMRLQSEMAQLPEGRFNTLRGHLVPYNRACQRSLGMSAGNLHRDCRLEDNAVECSHQKSVSKVSDQSTDSSLKQGKENFGFQNDKLSSMRASMQECHRGVNQNAESEVYFADVSSCCNVSVKADCCANQNVSALVGTIENHPESTSESDTGSFTLTRQQRPQPQVGSKRRPQKHPKDKARPEESSRIERIGSRDRLDCRMECRHDENFGDRMNEARTSERMNESQRMNDSRVGDVLRLNDSRLSERMNDSRLSERLSESQRMNDSRLSERLNESLRMNETRLSDKLNELHRMNDARLSERLNESQRLNESRISERLNELQRMNESRLSERLNESQRMNDSRISDRMNDSRLSERMNESQRSGFEDRRVSELNSSTRAPNSPKSRKHLSPLRVKSSPIPNHPRQSSSDSGKPEFFPPPPPIISPLSPNTEESLLSDEDQVYSNDPESSKCLGPDAQYEAKEEKELKVNHHHCYSDTNTMDSGWQSGSEKQVTD